MKRLLAVGILAAFAAGGYLWWKNHQQPGLPAGIVSGNGRVEATQIDIAAKYAGRVKEILVREGDLVSSGQILATMDTSELDAQLANAEAKVHEAEAQMSTAEARVQEYEAEVVTAQSTIKQSEADSAATKAQIQKSEGNFLLTKQQFARTEELYSKKVATKEEYDQRVAQRNSAQAELDTAKSRRSAAEAALDTAKSRLNSTEATLKAAKSRKLSAEKTIDANVAEVKRVQSQIDDSTLRSSVVARVLYRLAEPGEVLSAGGKALTLLDLTDIYMTIFVPSQQATRLSIGDEARVTLDAVPGYAARTHVTFVSPEAQFTPKQVETRSERDKLMFKVKLTVPAEAVKAHIDKIKTGIRGEGYVRIDPNVAWPEFLERRLPAPQP
ncbi:MAG TPA: HlyD family efflux transporter periplasmic adaptor subunit [Pirellulales bacterium]|jgi:HlyD family secretion protein